MARAGRGLPPPRGARGGRFLALASGEQFALPEAVGLLREVRRRAKSLELVSLSGADPLNLAGIVTPGETVPRGSGRVLYLDGVPIASQSGREVHMSEDLDRSAAWEARKALLRRGVGATRLLVAAHGTPTPGGQRPGGSAQATGAIMREASMVHGDPFPRGMERPDHFQTAKSPPSPSDQALSIASPEFGQVRMNIRAWPLNPLNPLTLRAAWF